VTAEAVSIVSILSIGFLVLASFHRVYLISIGALAMPVAAEENANGINEKSSLAATLATQIQVACHIPGSPPGLANRRFQELAFGLLTWSSLCR
jgi:hypothetical protein